MQRRKSPEEKKVMTRRSKPKGVGRIWEEIPPMGGFLPDPPEDCKYPEKCIRVEGRWFIDFTICLRYCGNSPCSRNKEHRKLLRRKYK